MVNFVSIAQVCGTTPDNAALVAREIFFKIVNIAVLPHQAEQAKKGHSMKLDMKVGLLVIANHQLSFV